MLSRRLKYLYLAYLSRPAGDRAVYRAIRRQQPQRILEIGVGDCQRAVRMIQLASQYHADHPVRYTGIDLFEARPSSESPGLSLKDAYRRLKATTAQTQVVPGDPFSALARMANSLSDVDLVVISADQDADALAKAWFYLPRTLHPAAQIFQEVVDGKTGQKVLQALERQQVEALSAQPRRRRAA
jgi:hypothetical protein